MDNPKARLYLDVDGCIRLNSRGAAWPTYTSALCTIRRRRKPPQVLETTWSPNLIDALRELTEAHSVELVWTSSWNDNLEVLTYFAPMIGWGAGARVAPHMADENSMDEREFTRWKANFVMMDSRDNVPFIWIDDDAVPDHHQLVTGFTAPTKSLLLAPQAFRGITPAMIEQMEAFLESL